MKMMIMITATVLAIMNAQYLSIRTRLL